MEKIIIYGLGKAYTFSSAYLTKTFDVVGYSDQKELAIEKYIKPYDIHKMQFDYIVVTSRKYYKDIKEELEIDFQVPKSKIVSENELLVSVCNAQNMVARETSISDDILYPMVCAKASKSEYFFNTFRLNPVIRQIYEHVSQEIGQLLLNIINSNSDIRFSVEEWNRFIENDRFGSPEQFEYSINHSRLNVAPTTLRYVKVLQDILSLYDVNDISTIAEIGIGYGGQCRIIMDYLKDKEYFLIDLPEILGLAEVYLNKFNILGKVHYVDGTQEVRKKKYDLVISNYAFSELNRDIQDFYLERVIDDSRSGYITWNSLSFKKLGGYSVEELCDRIYGASVIDEEPLTAQDNCIIIWGNVK